MELSERKKKVLRSVVDLYIRTAEPVGSKAITELPDMKYSSATIRNHDQVVTTGSTVYPRNLILGYIVDWALNDNGIAKYAILKPAADMDSLEQVFILTNFDTE